MEECPILSPLRLILIPVITLQILSTSLVASWETSFRVGLTHIDAGLNFSKLELIGRAMNRAKDRMEKIGKMTASTSNKDAKVPVHFGNGEYIMKLYIGNPKVAVSGIMDTGSDLIWMQCEPCIHCIKQKTPLFNPKLSSSFSNMSCDHKLCEAIMSSICEEVCQYFVTYGDNSSSTGYMATETYTLGEAAHEVTIPNVGFGCGLNNQGTGLTSGAGIVGLGRGPLSLVSQINGTKFSYCLTPIGVKKASSLFFGTLAESNFPGGENAIHSSTPMFQNPLNPSFYYISLDGITVGSARLPIPNCTFELQADGSGGLLIDSGTTTTRLHEKAYKLVKQAFVTQTKLRVVADSGTTGLDLCFEHSINASNVMVPKLVFHFKGLDLTLPSDNYMIEDANMGLICLALMATDSVSILGSIQQQNMMVLYDLDKNTLSINPTQCDRL